MSDEVVEDDAEVRQTQIDRNRSSFAIRSIPKTSARLARLAPIRVAPTHRVGRESARR